MESTLLATARRIQATQGFKKTKFFVLKYLQYYPHSQRWVRFIDGYYGRYTGEIAPVEMVRTKFLRSFYSRKLAPAARLSALKAHYDFLEAHFRNHMIRTLLSGAEIRLASMTGKTGGLYDIGMAQHPRYRAEGDLTLFLRRRGDDVALASLTFSFASGGVSVGADAGQGTALRIGGLQGPQADDAKQRVVDATRDLNGLRPKSAVLSAFYDIATMFGATTIDAVGMTNHPLNDRRHAVFADNDAFWGEQGAWRTKTGDFRLPLVPPQRALEDVAAKKRKDWLARNALRESLTAQIAPLLRSWCRVTEATRPDEDIRPELVAVGAPGYADFGLMAAE
jgi:uncharacterized protein VirK/YbjX